MFDDVNMSSIKLYVPAQSLDAYKTADVWKDFDIAAMPVNLDNASAKLTVGGADKTLTAMFDENYTGDKTITWLSSNPDIVSVIGGTLTAVSAGTATITATIDGGFGDVCAVEVVKGTGAAVVAPILAGRTHNSISINAIASTANGQTVEYGISAVNTADGLWWQTDLVFEGLFADMDYYIFARTVENDSYQAGAASVPLEVKTDATLTPIRDVQKSDGRYGIKITSGNIVSQKADFLVILPDNDKVLEVKAVIYDNVGNVLFEKIERGASVSWNLTNGAGRNVANGAYLVVAEARGNKGTYTYSAKVGVKR